MKIAVLGNKNTLLGFRLAGVKNAVLAAESEEALLEQFEKLAENEEISLIITDNSCSKIRKHLIRFIELNKKPLVIEIPGRNERIEGGIIETITKKATGAK